MKAEQNSKSPETIKIYKKRYQEKRILSPAEKVAIYNNMCSLYLQCVHLKSRRGYKNRAALFFMVECLHTIKDSFHHLYVIESQDLEEETAIRHRLLYSILDYKESLKLGTFAKKVKKMGKGEKFVNL